MFQLILMGLVCSIVHAQESPELSNTRLLRRASLAIQGRLPDLTDYNQLTSGTKTYQQFVTDYSSSTGFQRRMLELHFRPLLNEIIAEPPVHMIRTLGSGLSFRPLRLPPYVAGGVQKFFPDFESIQNFNTCDPTGCVLEAPLKALMSEELRVQLQQAGSYPTADFLRWFYRVSLYAAHPMDPYNRPSYQSRTKAGLLSEMDSSVFLLPGYFAGCYLPTEGSDRGKTTVVDTLGIPLRNGALAAVPVNPWWNPTQTIYVCPGVARAHANVTNGVALPSTYLSPTRYRLSTDPTTGRACSAFSADTYVNPHCDCGANLQLCNPLYQETVRSISLEASALYQHIAENNLAWKGFVTGTYRVSNRILEWLRTYRALEPKNIKQAVANGTASIDHVFNGGNWVLNGIWTQIPFNSMLTGFPAVPDQAWLDTQVKDAQLISVQLPANWKSEFVLVNTADSLPTSGVLTTATLLNAFQPSRRRVNKVYEFLLCSPLVPLPAQISTVDPMEAGLPPRLQVNSGCAGCHAIMDPVAGFYMGFPSSDNTNFSTTRRAQFDATLGQLHSSEGNLITAMGSMAYWGQNPTTKSPDQYNGISVTEGAKGFGRMLEADPRFAECAVKRTWRVMLGRDPSATDLKDVSAIAAKIRTQPFTLRQVAGEIANSPGFRRGL